MSESRKSTTRSLPAAAAAASPPGAMWSATHSAAPPAATYTPSCTTSIHTTALRPPVYV